SARTRLPGGPVYVKVSAAIRPCGVALRQKSLGQGAREIFHRSVGAKAGPSAVTARRRGSRDAQSRGHAIGSFDRPTVVAELSRIVAAGLPRFRSPMASRLGGGDDAAICRQRAAMMIFYRSHSGCVATP